MVSLPVSHPEMVEKVTPNNVVKSFFFKFIDSLVSLKRFIIISITNLIVLLNWEIIQFLGEIDQNCGIMIIRGVV